MSGFECEQPHDLGLMGNDVHILGYTCNNQWGAFISVLFGTLVIKLLQNKLWANQSQKQRELLQMPKKERWKGAWSSPMTKMLLLEFTSTVIGIISVLVIMGANFWIFLVIILSNLLGTAFTYDRMEMDHHSTATDIINMVKLIDAANNIEKSDQKCVNPESVTKAREAIAMMKRALRDSVPLARDTDMPAVINRRAQRGFVF